MAVEKIKELNVVTCGNCGRVFAHELQVEELSCPYCKYNDDICNFPDLFYPPQHNDSIIELPNKIMEKEYHFIASIVHCASVFAKSEKEAKVLVLDEFNDGGRLCEIIIGEDDIKPEVVGTCYCECEMSVPHSHQ